MYVDLNPIRAALAKTPETSNYTGAKDRIDDLVLAGKPKRCLRKGKASRASRLTRWERSRRRKKSGWMSPLEIDERTDPIGAAASHSGRRASSKGFLSISLTRYLELLDWTGRQLRSGKRGSIPATLSPILSRLGIETKRWCELVSRFSRLFRRGSGQLCIHSPRSKATRPKLAPRPRTGVSDLAVCSHNRANQIQLLSNSARPTGQKAKIPGEFPSKLPHHHPNPNQSHENQRPNHWVSPVDGGWRSRHEHWVSLSNPLSKEATIPVRRRRLVGRSNDICCASPIN